MTYYNRHSDPYRDIRRGRSVGDRFLAYLRTRSVESWAFFAAGFVFAAILT